MPSASDDDLGLGAPVEQDPPSVAPNPRLGINKGTYPASGYHGRATEACAGTSPDACRYGWFEQILCDVAAAGGSVVRQVGECDLVWKWMFESGDSLREIPDPAELYRLFTDDAGETFELFNMLLFMCLVHGVRVQPTVFTLGGGSNLNDGHADGDVFPTEDGTTMTYGKVRDVAPTAGVIVPAGGGWAPYYWDEGTLGTSPIESGDTADAKKAFERYCLHVLSHDTPVDDPYMLEAARRKSLTLAAFGTAVGEHLALWDRVLGWFGLSITDIVPYVELGNEMSVQWRTGEPGDDLFSASTRELATFMVSLAGPMQWACPKLRFSLPGIGAWGASDPAEWQQRIDWFHEAVAVGVLVELAHLTLIQQRRAMDTDGLSDAVDALAWDAAHPEQAAWIDTCDDSGLCIWPPPLDEGGLASRTWLHHVNMHWFHSSDHQGTTPTDGYGTEARLIEDIAYLKEQLLVNLIGNSVQTLSWALHPGGFPADQPASPDEATSGWSSFASPLFQAGMVVRILLVALSQGAEFASWHTHMAGLKGPVGEGWSIYQAMGLRVDIAEGPMASFRASTDAFRRPSWYAFRRLSALLSGGVTVTLLQNGPDGFMLLRLTRAGGFSGRAPELGLESAVGLYRYAYIAWIDQTSSRDSETFTLYTSSDIGDDGAVARLSLAPAVIEPDVSSGTDDCGYATGQTVRWSWGEEDALPGTGSGETWRSVADVTESIDADGATQVEVTVHRATRDGRPVPVCLFSNLDFVP